MSFSRLFFLSHVVPIHLNSLVRLSFYGLGSIFQSSLCVQAHRIRFEFRKGAAGHTFMRIDGEPWKQPLPVDDDKVVVEISHRGQVTMLATPSCRSRSVCDPSSPTCYQEDASDEEDEDWEERRKFGAADTFKFPDGFDIAQLS